MAIVLVRIDDRLIHGQVVVGWSQFLKAKAIIIADDEIEHDRYRVETMKMAAPPDIRVEIYNVAGVVEKFLHNELPKEKIILLFSRLYDFKRSLDLGFKTKEVNLGCIHSGEIEILNNITIKKEDVGCLKEIRQNGIHIDLRAVPWDKKLNLEDISMFQKLIVGV